MRWKRHISAAGLLVMTGCVSEPAAPRPGGDPADASAPEAAWAPPPDRLGESEAPAAEPKPEAGGVWTCPMHPEIRQEGPGTCPKCRMDLVPAKKEVEPGSGGHEHK